MNPSTRPHGLPPLFSINGQGPEPLVFERADGSFWLLGQAPLPPVITGPGHLLVEHGLAECMQSLEIARVTYQPATIVDRATDTVYRTHTRVRVGQFCRFSDLSDTPLDGLRLLALNDRHYVVNEALRQTLQAQGFLLLDFAEEHSRPLAEAARAT